MAKSTGSPITYSVAKIRERNNISLKDTYRLRCGNKNVKGDAILPLIPGASLMITKIWRVLSVTLIFYLARLLTLIIGLVNGAMVKFYGFADTHGTSSESQITSPQHICLSSFYTTSALMSHSLDFPLRWSPSRQSSSGTMGVRENMSS